MKQIFEIGFDGWKLTPELISALLTEYFNTMKYSVYGLSVKEIPGTGDPEIGASGCPIKEKSGSSDGMGKESVSAKMKSSVMAQCQHILTSTNENDKLICALSNKLLHVQIPSGISGVSGLSGKTGPTHPLHDILALISYKLTENNRLLSTIINRIDI